VLTPVGRADLDPAETLSSAGILPAEVLQLRQLADGRVLPGVVHNVRDRVEDLVDERDEFWGRRESRRLVLWTAILVGALGLVGVAVAGLAAGFAVADLPIRGAWPWLADGLLAATVALLLALTAITAARSGEKSCATAGLVVACGWGAVAGGAALRGWTVSPAGPSPTTMVLAGSASALLVAGCCVAFYPAALVHTAALLTVGGIAAAVAVAVRAGSPTAETAGVAAFAAILAIGAVPRMALAIGGVGGMGAGRNPGRLDARIRRADGVLTGLVTGLSLVAVLSAGPVAMSPDGWHRLFALGLGLALILRSRVFSQVRHALAVRVAAIVVVAELYVGLAIQTPALVPPLILGAVVALAVALAATTATVTDRSPVTRARVGRTLDLLEVALVVAMVVLAAGLLGWFGWLPAVID